MLFPFCVAVFFLFLPHQVPGAEPSSSTRPAQLHERDLADFNKLPRDRKQLLLLAMETGRRNGWIKYRFGAKDPATGGLDCSGAVHYLLGKAGLNPPRTSADQYLWVRDAGRLTAMPSTSEVNSLDHPFFRALKPGDLLFWSGTYTPGDGRSISISHVQIYLGRLKSDGRPVMIGATDGRSFAGRRQNGYGVYDFRLPRPGSHAVFAGYGPPPGIGGGR